MQLNDDEKSNDENDEKFKLIYEFANQELVCQIVQRF